MQYPLMSEYVSAIRDASENLDKLAHQSNKKWNDHREDQQPCISDEQVHDFLAWETVELMPVAGLEKDGLLQAVEPEERVKNFRWLDMAGMIGGDAG